MSGNVEPCREGLVGLPCCARVTCGVEGNADFSRGVLVWPFIIIVACCCTFLPKGASDVGA